MCAVVLSRRFPRCRSTLALGRMNRATRTYLAVLALLLVALVPGLVSASGYTGQRIIGVVLVLAGGALVLVVLRSRCSKAHIYVIRLRNTSYAHRVVSCWRWTRIGWPLSKLHWTFNGAARPSN